MQKKISPFLMFEGQAEAAMHFYKSTFDDCEIVSVVHHREGNMKGKVMHAVLSLNGTHYFLHDSSIKHDFTFTPSFSFFVKCDSEEEIDRLSANLSLEGSFLMPMDNYGFSKKFCWLVDQFGISWQLNLE